MISKIILQATSSALVDQILQKEFYKMEEIRVKIITQTIKEMLLFFRSNFVFR